MRAVVTLLPLLAACSSPSEATWMEGFTYEWDKFNHRVSYLDYAIDGSDAVISVIGGTSTTGVVPEGLAPECEDICGEFPFVDDAIVSLRWARTTSKKVQFASGTADLVATAGGATADLSIPLEGKGKGQVTALINGFSVDTDFPLSGGESCYRPEYGWHPRQIALEITDAALASDGKSVDIGLAAAFAAGNSLEDERICIDDVIDQAQVAVRIDVLAVVGDVAHEAHAVSHGMTYEWGCTGAGICTEPAEQPDPDLAERAWTPSFADALVGWSSIDYTFHATDPEDRGAYIRVMDVLADPVAGVASGHTNNYSPVTQLSGFEYQFDGEVVAVEVGSEIERGVVEGTIPVELEEDGTPTLHRLPL